MNQEEINSKLKEVSTRIKLLKRFVTREFSELVSKRFLEIEEEIENLRKEMQGKIQMLEEKIAELKAREEEEKAFKEALERLSKKIDRKILKELE